MTPSNYAIWMIVLVLLACDGDRPGEAREEGGPPAAAVPEPEPESEPELPPDPAQYTIHDVKDYSFGVIRDRLTIEMTTPETDSTRITEAMMRAALEVHSHRSPDVVHVRRWEVWPVPPEPSQAVFDSWTWERKETYLRQSAAIEYSVYYALDRCGWTGSDCDGTVWDGISLGKVPAWIRKRCPQLLQRPCRWSR